MRYQLFPLLLGSFALLFTVGCSSDRQSFSVAVRNETDTPITLILTKDHPQTEEMWASPEDLIAGRAVEIPGHRHGTVDLPANRTAALPAVSGEFRPGVHAVLRVYRGDRLRIKELEIMNPGPDRQDIVLAEGKNSLIIQDKGGKQLSILVLPVKNTLPYLCSVLAIY